MELLLNGKPYQMDTDATISELLATNDLSEKPVAVEVNRMIVPRSMHAKHVLQAGDSIEIVHAIGGG